MPIAKHKRTSTSRAGVKKGSKTNSGEHDHIPQLEHFNQEQENSSVGSLQSKESESSEVDLEELRDFVRSYESRKGSTKITSAMREQAAVLVKQLVKTTKKYSNFISECVAKSAKNKSEGQPALFTGGTLCEHQLEGYRWLKTLYCNGASGILADEMGLGKTAQAIAMICHLIEMKMDGPYLVCAPKSILVNWCTEIERFAPDVPVLMYHGNKTERKDLVYDICERHVVKNIDARFFPVVVTSYEMLMTDYEKLAKFQWSYLVIDECHRLKNNRSKLFGIVKRFNVINYLLLTGTPLQNSLFELWSLLNIILPDVFKDVPGFQNVVNVATLSSADAEQHLVKEEENNRLISSLQQIITPFLLRRTKQDVQLNIPPKKEVIVYTPLTELQRKYYCSILDGKIEDVLKEEAGLPVKDTLLNGDLPKRKRKKVCYAEFDYGESDDLEEESDSDSDASDELNHEAVAVDINWRMGSILTLLRKACLHPYLLCSRYDPVTKWCLVNEDLVKSSGKLTVLDLLLSELKKRGHKVLIFSQFVDMLMILADFCGMRGHKFHMLTGSTKLEDRVVAMKEFNTNPDYFVFLISTRAGGLGVNLTGADTVIIYDSDWNPQCDIQAQDRCHRIGQEKPVMIYRLVVEDTIDEEIVNRAGLKRKLEKIIIQDGRFCSSDTLTKSQVPLSKEELISLLRSSDVKETVRCTNKQIFTKQELDMLLDRSEIGRGNNSNGVFRVVS